jgi:zinc protease
MAGEVLDPGRATLVIAGDAKAFEAALRAKYPQAEIIPAAQLNLDSPTLR